MTAWRPVLPGPGRSLLDRALFSTNFEDILKRKVDLVAEPARHPLLRTQILQEAIVW